MTNFFKEKDFLYKNELYVKIDEYSDKHKNKVRIFRDTVTDAFVEIFLKDDTVRYAFIDYTFHQINIDIQTNINSKLTKGGFKPLYNDEHIIFSFKGGNVMAELGKLYLPELNVMGNVNLSDVKAYVNKDINTNVENNTEKNKIRDILDNISSKLSISDIDYTIAIYADNNIRYSVIYKYVVEIVSYSLAKISTLFNDELKKAYSDRNVQYPPSNTIEEESYEKYENDHALLLNILISIKEKIIDNSVRIDWTTLFRIIKSNINNILVLITICQIFESLLFIQTTPNISRNVEKNIRSITTTIKNTKDKLDKLLRYKVKYIRKLKIYTPDKLNEFKNLIVEKYSDENRFEKNKKYYEIFTDGVKNKDVNEYTLVKNPEIGDVDIVGRNNFALCSSQDIQNMHEKNFLTPQSNHYITFNNIIKVNNETNLVDFDLLRIKFNVILKKCIANMGELMENVSVPSEFIDVSIPIKNSDYFKFNFSNYAISTFGTNDKNISIVSLQSDNIVEDLLYVLYSQNSFCPWFDMKYLKRILRVIFFAFIHFKNNNKMHILKTVIDFIYYAMKNDKIKFKELSNKILRIDVDTLINVFLFKQFGMEVNISFVHDDYILLGQIIIFTVFINHILVQNPQEFLRIINIKRPSTFVKIDESRAYEIYNEYKEKNKNLMNTIVDYSYVLIYLHDKINENSVFDRQTGGRKIENPYTWQSQYDKVNTNKQLKMKQEKKVQKTSVQPGYSLEVRNMKNVKVEKQSFTSGNNIFTFNNISHKNTNKKQIVSNVSLSDF